MAVTWLKKGAASQNLAKQEQVAAEKRQSERGRMFRFFLKPKEEAAITFVDGELSAEGFLLPPRFYEHNLKGPDGKWGHTYICPAQTNPESGEKCPICEGGDRPSLVALFTVIDHRAFTGKDNKVFKDQPRLLVAKPKSFEVLQTIAHKRGGLAGARFDVTRMTEKDAAIGSMFDFMGKTPIEELRVKYSYEFVDPETKQKKIVSKFVPADYEKEFTYYSADELRKLGLGAPSGVSHPTVYSGSSEEPPFDTSQADYSGQL